jgi:hypothetical protein
MEKMFAVAGMSNLDGKVKVRFANEMARVKVLEKNGHTDVRLVALAAAMTKDAAVAAFGGASSGVGSVVAAFDSAPIDVPAKSAGVCADAEPADIPAASGDVGGTAEDAGGAFAATATHTGSPEAVVGA